MAKFVMERSIEDSYIIDTVKDLLIDSDDEGFECRIWVNNVTHPSHIKYREKLDLISIEIHNKLPMDNDKSNIVYETIILIMNYLKILYKNMDIFIIFVKNIKLMDKIWFINDSYKGVKYYHTEKSFKKAIKKVDTKFMSRTECGTYTLTEKINISEFIKSQERDKSIRCVLGQLSESEKVELNLKSKVDKYLSIVFKTEKERTQRGISNSIKIYSIRDKKYHQHNSQMLHDKLVEMSDDFEGVLRLIKDSDFRHYVFGYSDSVEYYEALLGIHNFKSLDIFVYKYSRYDPKKRIIISSFSETHHENFKIAKSNLK